MNTGELFSRTSLEVTSHIKYLNIHSMEMHYPYSELTTFNLYSCFLIVFPSNEDKYETYTDVYSKLKMWAWSSRKQMFCPIHSNGPDSHFISYWHKKSLTPPLRSCSPISGYKSWVEWMVVRICEHVKYSQSHMPRHRHTDTHTPGGCRLLRLTCTQTH